MFKKFILCVHLKKKKYYSIESIIALSAGLLIAKQQSLAKTVI
jgi:hypothetical protein